MTAEAEALAALERFVVENDDLLDLESRIGRFNIFDALGIARVEIRHSNFLAFILDPAESHGQGQVFLKAVLMDLLRKSPQKLRPLLSPIDLDGVDLLGIEVKREWKGIDILIRCKKPCFFVVIENKVYSQEHSDQLSRYEATMKEHFPNDRALFVYLTRKSDESSQDTWVPYSYEDIHRVLTRARNKCKNVMGADVLVFLDHYLSLIGTRFMDNPEIDALCQRIYQNHRQALDLIWDRFGGPESAHLVEVVNLLEQDARWHVLYHSGNYVDFVPKAWLGWLPKFGPEDDYPLCVHVRSRETRVTYTIFVGPMENTRERIEIITKLRDESPSCGFKRSKASRVEGKWNRICAVEVILEWSEDEEPDPVAIRARVKKMLDELCPNLERLALVLKPLCGR